MEAILLSIQKKYLGKILTGEKTIEIRKTRPNVSLPFTVFFYETAADEGAKRVLASGICDDIEVFRCIDNLTTFIAGNVTEQMEAFSCNGCISQQDLYEYGRDCANLYGWHISQIKKMDCSLSDFGIRKPPQSWQYLKQLKNDI